VRSAQGEVDVKPDPAGLVSRLRHGLVPAVPVPWSHGRLDEEALAGYVRWMAGQPVAGVAVSVHTGRGRHLAPADRRRVLAAWRSGLPHRVIVVGAWDAPSAAEARDGGADAILAFPSRDEPLGYHERLARHLPVVLFYLYEAAGGVAWPMDTLRELLALPGVIGIKVATLDSVMTFQDIAVVVRDLPDKLLITGEDRFLGYSLLLGAQAALIGMGAALADAQAALLRAREREDWARFVHLAALCDDFARVTFRAPMEGYVRRMLWAAAADGAIPPDACDDPWGPALPAHERDEVERVVRRARSTLD
jgi:4-hydroxy-tetrahydrodipicolinate synthase